MEGRSLKKVKYKIYEKDGKHRLVFYRLGFWPWQYLWDIDDAVPDFLSTVWYRVSKEHLELDFLEGYLKKNLGNLIKEGKA